MGLSSRLGYTYQTTYSTCRNDYMAPFKHFQTSYQMWICYILFLSSFYHYTHKKCLPEVSETPWLYFTSLFGILWSFRVQVNIYITISIFTSACPSTAVARRRPVTLWSFSFQHFSHITWIWAACIMVSSEVKLSHVYQHSLQCFITSPVLVLSSCVHYHT